MILVGEMRDTETAETAIHAALTGHLVSTTMHTKNAAGAIPRLINMGAKPYVLAPALNMIIAQRLVRVVCKHCAQAYEPDNKLRERIREAMRGLRADIFDPSVLNDKSLTFMRAAGCTKCTGGYKGRVGAFEIFTVEQEIEELVLQGADENRIQSAALKHGMTTIAQDAFLKVIAGQTTIEEVERISSE
jgi:type II secretory ATPase GspE/PulE/Tfp pilus assembly ATPase PilB-like protein